MFEAPVGKRRRVDAEVARLPVNVGVRSNPGQLRVLDRVLPGEGVDVGRRSWMLYSGLCQALLAVSAAR